MFGLCAFRLSTQALRREELWFRFFYVLGQFQIRSLCSQERVHRWRSNWKLSGPPHSFRTWWWTHMSEKFLFLFRYSFLPPLLSSLPASFFYRVSYVLLISFLTSFLFVSLFSFFLCCSFYRSLVIYFLLVSFLSGCIMCSYSSGCTSMQRSIDQTCLQVFLQGKKAFSVIVNWQQLLVM